MNSDELKAILEELNVPSRSVCNLSLIARGRGRVIIEDLRQMWQAESDKLKNGQEEVIIEGEAKCLKK